MEIGVQKQNDVHKSFTFLYQILRADEQALGSKVEI